MDETKNLVKELFKITDSSNYSEDWHYKNCGGVFGSFTADIEQWDLKSFVSFLDEWGFLTDILRELQDLKTEYIYHSHLHGIYHNARVMLYTMFIARQLELTVADCEVVVPAALYHDIGRVNDKEDGSHGCRSAQLIEQILPRDYADMNMLKAVIELHSIDDKHFAAIAQKHNIVDRDRFKTLYSVLKDVDALDRVRLTYYNSDHSELNPNMLRLPISRQLVKVAHQLNEFFVKHSKKRSVILDTDIENEIDDKYALTYLLQNQWMFDIEAVTIAPFYGSKYSIIKDNNIDNIHVGVEASYQTALKVMDMVGATEFKNRVFRGSTGTISNGYNSDNDAVNKIIEICMKNKHTDIMCIAALTNIALALRKEPRIANKAHVIWLGGNDFAYGRNDEFNFRQDIQAVREVFESGIELTVIPCVNVGSIVLTTEPELREMLSEKGEIGKYLYEEFCRCKPAKPGKSKTIWDLAVIAYLVNSGWFEERKISRPEIAKNGDYRAVTYNPDMTIVTRISRDAIFRDFFGKVSSIEHRNALKKERRQK